MTAAAGAPETWVDSPVARTDQSFTVSAWLRPDALTGPNTIAMSVVGNVPLGSPANKVFSS